MSSLNCSQPVKEVCWKSEALVKVETNEQSVTIKKEAQGEEITVKDEVCSVKEEDFSVKEEDVSAKDDVSVKQEKHVSVNEVGGLTVNEVEDTLMVKEPRLSPPNSVDSLLKTQFERLTLRQKLDIKQMGPDKPDIWIQQTSKDRGKKYTRNFSSAWYERKSWLCGCPIRNSVFCFPCLLFRSSVSGQAATLWTETGMSDLKHFAERVKKHDMSKSHLECLFKLTMLGKAKLATQLEEGYHANIRKHNLEVDKNRHILSKVLDCLKFCGAFELALKGHDEAKDSDPGVFRGLVDFMGSLDSAMKDHLEATTVFKGTSKTVQNELLDCMLATVQAHIVQELRNAAFVSIIVDETTDITTHCQLVIIYRYVDATNTLQERFFSFIKLEGGSNAEAVSRALLENLGLIFPDQAAGKEKLIAQTCDWTSLMCRSTAGVGKIIQDEYPNAHFLHCYAQQLCLVMQKAASAVQRARVFFSDLSGFSTFFWQSQKRIDVLNRTVTSRLPRAPQTRLNFQSRPVNVVFEHKDHLLECFQTIQSSEDFDNITIREATGFVRMLQDKEFLFFLELFHHIMRLVDILSAQLDDRHIEASQAQEAVKDFTNAVSRVRDSVPSLCVKYSDAETRIVGDRQQQAYEVCDRIILNTNDRFTFTHHLTGATLLESDCFPDYAKVFPTEALAKTAEAYPTLNKARLQTELSLMYDSPDFRWSKSALALFKFMLENNLQEVFSETVKLLRILITTPMTTSESDRCFSTLRRVRTFLGSTVSKDRLHALAMLSTEKKLTREIPDFNKKVIEKFSLLKNRRAKFVYK
ncbi:zinc finger MYM-type protein 1-like [Esox lucius]|uniref:TTF-type domain-containing protein n=1 Tax=Esox lucius TaxID=8010 RepID=A0A3P8Z1B7_ESOLU|nr:zinc finger MYM-type protein 1-like [Esox lucius]